MNKRIAICFSGQPRTWEKCKDTWITLIGRLEEKFGAKVDVFCHAWDFNTPSHAVIKDKSAEWLQYCGKPVSEEEKTRFIEALRPVDYIFGAETSSLASVYETLNRSKQTAQTHGNPSISWASSQFYAVMRVAHLKKMYEYNNGFRYDMCIRMRYDLFFDDSQIDCLINSDFKLQTSSDYNTLYSCHTRKIDDFPFVILGDIFFYSSSVIFDRICDFYRWFPVMGHKSFKGLVGTEHNFYFYAKMLGIDVTPISTDPKIFRDADYIEKKIEIGLPGELGNHELC